MKKASWMIGLAFVAAAAPARADELLKTRAALAADPAGGAGLNCLYEANCAGTGSGAIVAADRAAAETKPALAFSAARPAAGAKEAEVPAPEPSAPPRAKGPGVWAGIAQGAEQGALLGFFIPISPAVSLLDKSMSLQMGHYYDGRSSGAAGLYQAGAYVAAAVLYVPALALGAVGGVLGAAAGGVSEVASPGATKSWDVEKRFFD